MANEIAQKERGMLILEARDACARRVSMSSSISSADSAQMDLKFRLKKVNAMTDEQLTILAKQRELKIGAMNTSASDSKKSINTDGMPREKIEEAVNAGKVRMDEWSCIYPAPTGVPFELKPTGDTFRGMKDLDKAKAYAEEVADFFFENGLNKRVFVVKGPTSTTKSPFEVVTATSTYTVAHRTALRGSPEADAGKGKANALRP